MKDLNPYLWDMDVPKTQSTAELVQACFDAWMSLSDLKRMEILLSVVYGK